MKWVVLIFFLPILATTQGGVLVSNPDFIHQTVSTFLATDGSSLNTASFDEHLKELSDKRSSFKNDQAFLRFVFHNTHRKFLKNFKEYASFGQLLKKGDYNCLTATALYALVLEHAGIRYEIIETDYHIFLMAYLEDGTVMMETTDPLKGFVVDRQDIEKRIRGYKQNSFNDKSDSQEYYRLGCNLYNVVRLDEITGLLHYNLAIAAFNNGQVEATIAHLDEATSIYSSPRMEALTRLVLLSVVESKLDAETKESTIKRIQALRKRNLMALAQASR